MLNLQNNAHMKSLQRVMPTLVSVVLLLVASYSAAQITWQLLEPAPNVRSKPAQQNTQKTSRASNNQFQQNMIQLNNAHLFGVANAPVARQATKDAPETTLNLVLRGVLAAKPMTLASAIISSGKHGKELTYGVGDSVPGNATIEEIYQTHVILMRNGRHETLKLPEKSVGGTTSKSTYRTNKTGAINLNQTPDRILGDIRRNIMKNPTSFGEYAIPVPVSKNGKLQGYRLRPQKKGRELFKQFGLQRNDIVTQINGVALNDPVQGIAALRKLTNASSINLTVMRNGVETPLQFNIR